MEKICLNGEWILRNCTSKDETKAVVPGTNFGNLIREGKIVNPLISGKEEEGLKIAKDDYEFERKFNLDKSILKYNHVYLMCHCFDTLFTCYINGEEAFKGNNAYIPVKQDIKAFLKEGENTILVHFNSPTNYIMSRQKEKSLPKNFNGVDGIPYIRKPGCHFGWDWGPCVPYSGILADIELKAVNELIDNIKIKQDTSKEISRVEISADGCKKIVLKDPDGKEIKGENGVFEIENPKLWYTRELSQKDKQPLYEAILSNDDDEVTKKIGLRSVYLDRSKDEYGENFCITLNGEKVFAKGANLIPFSAIFEDANNDTVDYYLDMAIKSNFNCIRVWGGGFYADEYLLSRCDELGILIWQDFCFACQLYPFYEEDFKQNVLNEVKANVTRMDLHPSLALWCGNNEIEAMYNWMPKIGIVADYIEFFYNTLPEFIKDLTSISYIPSSPLGTAPFKNNTIDGVGDTHMWNVWHGLKPLDYYATRYSRFLSEFGLESLPSMKAIKTFTTKEDYYITSESFNNHQKCIGGNRKMIFYMYEMFNDPKHFEDMPYLTGIVQAECIKNATIHFRQNKGRCNGSIYWQYNDVWNCPSWSSVDFEGVPKALQYSAKKFFDPLCISVKKEKGKATLFLHNDTLNEENVEYIVKVCNKDGEVEETYTKNASVKANSFVELETINISKNQILRVEYLGKEITEIFVSPCDMKLKEANLQTKIENGVLYITSDTFAYGVCIESDKMLEDNYFSMLKGETKAINIGDINDVNITCTNNIEFKSNTFKKKWYRFRYRLEPLNIANATYYATN